MKQALAEVFADVFRFEGELRDSLTPDAVKNWDSFGHLTLIQRLETRFEVSISDADAMSMDTVGKIRAVLRRLGVDV